MSKSKFIMETYFSGDAREWLNQIPESIIDKAIEILSIDPNKEMEPKGYSPVDRDLSWWNTAKACFWGELVRVIHRWGMPSPTQMQTSPANLKKHTADLKETLSEALTVLKDLEYGPLFDKGTMTKEFKVADRIRQQSEIIRANREGKPGQFVGALVVKQEYESTGEWGKHYPFDHELEITINGLEKIIGCMDAVFENTAKTVAPQGKSKKGKDNADTLIWALCHLFKKYTGESPLSSANEDGTATGKIIPFLQLILPETSYSFEITDWALEKKIRGLKSHKTHGKLWEVAKN